MELKEFWVQLTAKEKAAFARRVGRSVPYISQIAHGHVRPGGPLVLDIVKATGRKVSRKSLRPDIWG